MKEIPVKKPRTFSVDQGRKVALIELETEDGEQVTLALKEEPLTALFIATCDAIPELAALAAGQPQSLVLEASGMKLMTLRSGRLGATFSLGKTELTFAVPAAQVEDLIQALRRMRRGKNEPPEGASRH